MRLDMVITFGNVLEIFAIVVGTFAAYAKLRERLVSIETRLEPVWNEFTERRQKPRRVADRSN